MTDDELDSIRAVLATTVPRWHQLVEAATAEALARPAADGEWSALDCLRHMAGGERLLASRLADYREGRPEVTPPVPNPDETAALSAARALALLAERREATRQALAGLTAADTVRTVRHPERGEMALGELLNAWVAHDLQHTVQAEEALMQPLIAGAGYLRPIFADHDTAARTG